ncbi:hypothetical protein [Nonomuraea recticatena]|uniref:hypothetical protein n=1 Tax=Nonomuraea recticatena TaxID=46178 RepID=UPI00360AF0D8
MESFSQDEPEAGAPLAHYSTGRLTAAQAATIARWRARLQQDKPLPGLRPKGPVLRMLGIDDRPPASCSDVIASVVKDLLDQAPPAELDIARYHYRAVQAQKRAGQGDVTEHAAIHQPVSFYLPQDLADHYERLRRDTYRAMIKFIQELKERALEEYPDEEPGKKKARALFVWMQLAKEGLPRGRPGSRAASSPAWPSTV